MDDLETQVSQGIADLHDYEDKIQNSPPLSSYRFSDLIPFFGQRNYKRRNFNTDSFPEDPDLRRLVRTKLSLLRTINMLYLTAAASSASVFIAYEAWVNIFNK